MQRRWINPKTQWRSITVPHWYSAGPRTIRIATGTAVWYHAGLPVVPLRWVLILDPRHEFRPQALLCTDPGVEPEQVVPWFVLRWQMETTWEETRAPLGIETQRPWSDRAIARTTPCLLALFSLVTLLAADLHQRGKLRLRRSAWYSKTQLTFSDTIAAVRQQLWTGWPFAWSLKKQDQIKIPRLLFASAAAAVLVAGLPSIRDTAISGGERAPYCLMGVCFDCLAEIDGVANRQSCMVSVRPGMRIRRQSGARGLAVE